MALVCGCIGGETRTASETPENDVASTTTLVAPTTTVSTTSSTTTTTSSTITTTTTTTSTTTTTIAGAVGSRCETYKDCRKNLLCKNSICTTPPVYTTYFSKIELQKMKARMPPGPKNIPVAATTFTVGDGMNVELTPKPGVSGEVYIEIVDAVTGETSQFGPKFRVAGQTGEGTTVPTQPGKYELNIYFNDKLIHTIPFEVTG